MSFSVDVIWLNAVGEVGQLVAAGDLDPVIEVAARHRDRAAVQLGDRRAEAARPEQREHERERERAEPADDRASGSRAPWSRRAGRDRPRPRSMPTGVILVIEQRGRRDRVLRRSATSSSRITRWPRSAASRSLGASSTTGSARRPERRAERDREPAVGAADAGRRPTARP